MAYKIMIDNDYMTDDGIMETIPVEYDGIKYNTRVEALKAFWNSKDCDILVGYHIYVKEV